MNQLVDTTPDNIGLHLKNIYVAEELSELAATEDFYAVQQEYDVKFNAEYSIIVLM